MYLLSILDRFVRKMEYLVDMDSELELVWVWELELELVQLSVLVLGLESVLARSSALV